MTHTANRGTNDDRTDYAMRMRTLAVLGVIIVLAGCAQTRDVRPPGPGHPASVESASIPFSPPSNPFAVEVKSAGEPETSPPTHDMHTMPGMSDDAHGSADALTVYTCPMHPDIRADRPGNCPKCGMTLTPTTVSRPLDSHGEGPR